MSSIDHLCRWPRLREEKLGRGESKCQRSPECSEKGSLESGRYGDFPWWEEPLKGFTQELSRLRSALQKFPGSSVEGRVREKSLRAGTLSHREAPRRNSRASGEGLG